MKKLIALSVLCASLLPFAASADDKNYLENKTVVRLSETASKDVAPDRLKATLRFEFSGKNTAVVQSRVNQKLATALKIAKKVASVKASTGAYSIHQKYNNNLRRHDGWTATQTLMLDSADQEELLELAGILQKEGFMMNGLAFYLSLDKTASMRDSLITASLERVQKRIQTIATQLGLPNNRIAELNVQSSRHRQPQPMMMRAMSTEMASDGMAAPVAAASDQTVGITVTATVHLW